MLNILLIDDEKDLRELLSEQLSEADYKVQVACDGAEGKDLISKHTFDVVICDVRLPKIDGISLFRHIRKEAPSTKVILITAYADVGQAVSALKEGAYDYLTKPFEIDELLMQCRRIAENLFLRRDLENARSELSKHRSENTLIGQCPGIRRVMEMCRMVSTSDVPILIKGETGTGKEVVARMIHENSSRRDKPFIAVNCGALAENLIEAELFGHERGAFTGAIKKREGRFKSADGGVLFLDEIAELPTSAQAKLLRVLQEGTFEPIGTNNSVRVDVRIISATHRNLQERIKSGLFREDLFYRINVIEIPLPPLRERPGDLPLLLHHFLAQLTPAGAGPPTITSAAWASLLQYDFPGNVRELSHAVEHALVLSGGKEIDLQHLPHSMTTNNKSVAVNYAAPPPAENTSINPLHSALREFEQQYLQRALKAANGKRTKAAAMLGISRKTLWEKLRTVGLATDEPDDSEDGNTTALPEQKNSGLPLTKPPPETIL